MGFLGKLFGKKENDTIENTVTQQITTEKKIYRTRMMRSQILL